MLYRHRGISACIIWLMLLCSCTSGAPSSVMSTGKMEDVLFDMHLARALAQQMSSDSIDFYSRLYQQAVFNKYSIDEATFDSSMVWYSRHTDQLEKIYERIAERLGDTSGGGSSTLDLADARHAASIGDTLNVWRGSTFVLLSSQGCNRFTFEQRADTALQADDLLQLRYNVDWHYNDGDRRAQAMLIVHYEGDSIATASQYVISSGKQVLSLHLAKRRIERIEGFIYQSTGWSEKPRLLALTGLKLLRIRQRKESAESSAEHSPDSLKQLPTPAKLIKKDSAQQRDPAMSARQAAK